MFYLFLNVPRIKPRPSTCQVCVLPLRIGIRRGLPASRHCPNSQASSKHAYWTSYFLFYWPEQPSTQASHWLKKSGVKQDLNPQSVMTDWTRKQSSFIPPPQWYHLTCSLRTISFESQQDFSSPSAVNLWISLSLAFPSLLQLPTLGLNFPEFLLK